MPLVPTVAYPRRLIVFASCPVMCMAAIQAYAARLAQEMGGRKELPVYQLCHHKVFLSLPFITSCVTRQSQLLVDRGRLLCKTRLSRLRGHPLDLPPPLPDRLTFPHTLQPPLCTGRRGTPLDSRMEVEASHNFAQAEEEVSADKFK